MQRILFVTMPPDGEVIDTMTPTYYKREGVKYMPLGLLSVAANVPAGYEVSVLDASSRRLTLGQTIAEIEACAPDILGLSVVTYRAWAMMEILKRTSVPVKVVGGPHATYNHGNILRQGADAVFVGDAEISFPKWLHDGCPKGVFDSPPVPLDTLPFPARHLLDANDYMIKPEPGLMFDGGYLRLPMYSSKGCPMQCIYCDVQQKTYNFKSARRCVEEIEVLIGMGATSVHIMDDAFNIQKNRVLGLTRGLLREQVAVEWSARGMVETREDIVAELVRAGCKRLHVGVEHLDDEVLEYLNKWQRVSHIRQFCEFSHKYGMEILAYFIIGVPGETPKYRQELPRKVRELGIKFPFFNVLTPMYMTAYYRQLLREGKIRRDYWAEFCANPVQDFQIPTGRSQEEALELGSIIEGYIEEFSGDRSDGFDTGGACQSPHALAV